MIIGRNYEIGEMCLDFDQTAAVQVITASFVRDFNAASAARDENREFRIRNNSCLMVWGWHGSFLAALRLVTSTNNRIRIP